MIFFPFDLTFIVSRFLTLFDPRLIVIVESDFWPTFLLPPEQAREIRGALGYGSEDVVIIGGSVHEREDGVLRGALIIVPRYLRDAGRVARAMQARGQLPC